MENQNITTQEKAKWEVPSNNQRKGITIIILIIKIVLNFLKEEVNRRNDLKVIKEKVDRLDLNNNKPKQTDYNMIYKFKLESKNKISKFI